MDQWTNVNRFVMIVWFCAFATTAGAWQAVSEVKKELPVQRIAGDRALTPDDETEVARLLAPHGKPWLILEPVRGQIVGSWSVIVYLQPTEDSGLIRRGRAVSLRAVAVDGELNLIA